jgi:phosphatidyl-myo-inositol alpha-mannosyltransferase
MRKLTIGLVFDDSLDKPDGVQQYVLMMGRWLTAQGHAVHYLVGETARTDLSHMHSLSRNVTVRFNQNRMAIPLPARLKPIRAVLAAEKFDVLHIQVPYSPALAGRIIKAAAPQTAVVGTFHVAPYSNLVTLGNRLLGLWVRGSLRRFDAMMSTSVPAAQFAKQTFKIDSAVVPLPLELGRFYDSKPFTRYIERKNVVFLGRLVERKGCQYLLQAVAQLHAGNIWPVDAHVTICGGGPLERQLKQYVTTHKLDDIVEFTGYISEEDKPRYLAGADVVVYPSTGGESFGIVLLEAMAAARGAVLAGNNPGYASVMAPRPDSLFDPRDTKELANKLRKLLTSTRERTVSHRWQREYVRQFDIPEVGAQVMRIYHEALKNRPH